MSEQPNPTPSASTRDDVEAILASAEAAGRVTAEKVRQQQAADARRNAVLTHLLSACNYTVPTGRTTDPQNWTTLLYLILKCAAPFVEGGDIPSRLRDRGEARKVVRQACEFIRAGDAQGADKLLGRGLDSATLAPGLWKELSGDFPEDVGALLPDDLRERFEEMRDGKPQQSPMAAAASVSPAPSAPQPCATDDAAGPEPAPAGADVPLAEPAGPGESGQERALSQQPPPPVPPAPVVTEGGGDEVGLTDDGKQLPQFMCVSDLAKITNLTEDQAGSLLRRHREDFPDCFRELEGRRRNEPRIMYRTADVLPLLRDHGKPNQ
jgi:hypothetical protein